MSDDTDIRRKKIFEVIARVVNENRSENGLGDIEIHPETELVGQMDSLAIAGLVFELESETGRSPFAEGIVPFKTVGDMAEIYLNAKT